MKKKRRFTVEEHIEMGVYLRLANRLLSEASVEVEENYPLVICDDIKSTIRYLRKFTATMDRELCKEYPTMDIHDQARIYYRGSEEKHIETKKALDKARGHK